jgi:hypothetical protein
MGTSMSSPSIEKRVLPGKVRWRNRSNAELRRLPEPAPLLRDEDVREVVSGRGTVDAAEHLDRIERRGRALDRRLGDQAAGQRSQVFIGHAMGFRLQRRIADRTRAERIQLRGEMSVAAD